ncbi:prolyl oligopeptidase family serine peptidase [Pedobacter sp. PF22-3]|uniref:glucuronyl esterase domain-containing protein n=1 Tax=Pedobacter sp. PF22-3 TaxID=2994467 RepID=UPI00224552D5|nr:prolyl oligopeptidase family serine peptidase [Pedobacter sp. PF22-3]MCX2492905.1 prolyl oligopeptidase family serine peptidase [Pedobacter sp. PF22-3]
MMNRLKSFVQGGNWCFNECMKRALVCFIGPVFLSAGVYAQQTDRFMGEIVNYDESTVPAYTLPDILLTAEGKKIKAVSAWEKHRRPEVLALFEEHVYGKTPARFDSLKFVVTKENVVAMAGKAYLKEITITAWNSGNSVSFPVVLFIPNKRTKPAPVFLLINNRSSRNTDPTRIEKSDFWPAEMVIDSGYAIAAFHHSDVAPDRKDSYQNGVLKQLFPEELEKDNGMKAIGVWAWAASRVMDYFKTDKEIDSGKVVLVGHSRGGKTALWAAAQDQRFAMVLSSCSGSTGASLARRKYGETISLINKQFGYWFNNNYKKYSNDVNSLPLDQHMLIGLVAPRPVYTTNATEDRWADPYGSFSSLVQAKPVYDLYGKKVTLPANMPGVNKPIIHSAIGYHFREGKHDLNIYDWTNFIRFAKLHFNL